MSLEKLKLEKNKIIDLQNDYFNRLINEIILFEKKITEYKSKLDESQNIINQLTLELKLKEQEIVDNKREIQELRMELTKTEDEIYNLRATNTYNKIELLNDLKEAFAEENDGETEDILDELLEEINDIENEISYEDMMFIIYLCYIYDKLQLILSKSTMANSYYSSNRQESKLLKIVSQEEHIKIYNSIEECTQNYIKKETDLFKNLNIKLKERIVGILYDISYKCFENVYNENNIERNDTVVKIKCWVRDKENLTWRLVSATYSDKQRKIYMPKNMIDILNLSQQESILINESFEKIKNIFLNEESSKLKKLMRATSEKKEREIFSDIVNLNISEETLDLNKAYTLLLISIFYRRHENLLSNSEYLRNLIQTDDIESKLIYVLKEEITLKPGGAISLPVRLFMDKYKEKIKCIDKDVKNKVIELAKSIFYKECNNVLGYENLINVCYYDNSALKLDTRYVKVFNGYEYKYVLCNSHVCFKCNSIYIKQKTIRKIEGKLDGFQIIVNPEITKKNNVNKKDNLKETAITLYNTIINEYRINNIMKALRTYNNIIENKEIIKYYNKNQRITLLFIGYLIKGNTYGSTEILEAGDIGMSVDTILYRRLYNGTGFKSYLNEYKNSIAFIDPYVREKILYNIKELNSDKEDEFKLLSFNQNELDSNKLNSESEIKKMGYSTSLTREERWNILKNKAVPKLGKAKVIGHIRFLIKMNKSRSVMFNAVSEWEYDLERLIKL